MDSETLHDAVHATIGDDTITTLPLSTLSSMSETELSFVTVSSPSAGVTLAAHVDLSGSLASDGDCLPLNSDAGSLPLVDETDMSMPMVPQQALPLVDMNGRPVEMHFEPAGDVNGSAAVNGNAEGNTVAADDINDDGNATGVTDTVNDDASRVFFIYQDILTCGTCNKHFLDLMDFLHHKGSHSIGDEGYKCELCKTLFFDTATLSQHYLDKHEVELPGGEPSSEVLDSELHDGKAAEEHVTNGTGDVHQSGAMTVGATPPDVDSKVGVVAPAPARRRKRCPRATRTVHVDVLLGQQEGGGEGADGGGEGGEGDRRYVCPHCAYESGEPAGMTAHMAACHGEVLPAGGDALSAVKTEGGAAAAKTRAKAKAKTRRHRGLETQDVPGTYPCATCGKTFGRLRYLRKHSDTHRTDRRFVCAVCTAQFKTKTYLAVHVRCVHGRAREFRCTRCDFTSRVNAAIQAHRQLHAQPGAVWCEACGLAYADRATLNKHRRVHDERRPFACPYVGCTWRFNTEHMCRAHTRAHTVPGAFRCSVCGYAFRHKHHLQRHETNMHGIARTTARGWKRHAASATTPETVLPPGGGGDDETATCDDVKHQLGLSQEQFSEQQ